MTGTFKRLRIGALASGGLLLAIAVVCEALAGWPEGALSFLAAAVTTASWLVAAGVATLARPRMLIGWLLVFGGFTLALDGALTSFAEVIASRDMVLAAWAGWVGSWMFWPQLTASAAIYLLFPDGGLPSRKWGWAAALAVVGAALGACASALSLGPLDTVGPLEAIANPLGLVPGIQHLIPVAAIILNVAFVAGLVALRLRKV